MDGKFHSDEDGFGEFSYKADLCGNIEQALKGLQGYGLMALELIQNADDAGARTLSFDATTHSLIVRNDAEFTSCGLLEERCPWELNGDPDARRRPCNFHAIALMGSRNKLQVDGQTGRFGIGFVSVYQITDTPIIRSAGIQIQLNPLTGKVTKTRVATPHGTEFDLRWASRESEIRSALNASPTPPDVAQRLVGEVLEVLRSSLLFLRHLKRVEVRAAGSPLLTVQIDRGAEEVSLTFSPELKKESWLVLSRDADDIVSDRGLFERYPQLKKLNRSTRVSIALALDEESDSGLLYAYLPTRQKTGMPVHINGDFFPHASRQNIVREGEGHERYWNEALLATVAVTIGERFAHLRDRLGHRRLWHLGTKAFGLKDDKAFGVFWEQFAAAAKSTESAWSTSEEWVTPSSVHWPPDTLLVEEQAAVASLGLALLHSDLRPHLNALGTIGVRELRLNAIVTGLEERDGAGIAHDNPHLRPLWDAIARLVQRDSGDKQFSGSLERLKAATFLIDTHGRAIAPSEIWRTPIGVRPSDVNRYLPDCPFVHPEVMSRQELVDLIDLYKLDDFAAALADLITNEEDARRIIGSDPDSCRALYTLMLGFDADAETTDAGVTLVNTPFLRTVRGFVSPVRGSLPGGFHDPVGYLELVDLSAFPDDSERMLRDIFKVNVLSFRDYIDAHLEDLLTRQPTRDQYAKLLSQIVQKRYELEEMGGLDLLSERGFVRTRAGTFVRPDDCYYWKAELEAILGADQNRWVDDEWMPRGLHSGKMRDLLEDKLGMPTAASPRHIVNRVEELAGVSSPEEIAKPLASIMRHLVERWRRFTEDDFEALEPLKELEYVPAEVDGKLDEEALYAPHQVYRVTRSKGFESQVRVVALAPLRQSSAALNEVLEFLGLPDEPATGVVVAHLRHCMETQTPVSEITYAILNERLEKGDSVDAINALSDTAFIHNGDLDRYLKADQVFWEVPPLGGGYWWRANDGMVRHRTLYSKLGVQDRPGPAEYADLVKELVLKDELTDDDLRIYDRCICALCEALQDGGADALTAVYSLKDTQCLLNVDSTPVFPEDAIWIDVDQLATPFGADLNEYLVRRPSVERGLAARLFRHLDVSPISDVAHRQLAEEPDRKLDEAATSLLRDRKDLILWLLPAKTRQELSDTLSRIRILTSTSVVVRTEIAFDPPVLSPPKEVKAFLEDRGDLHVEDESFRRGWTAVFRELFSLVEQRDSLDIAPLVFAANQIMQSASLNDAESELREAGFTPPAEVPDDIAPGETLKDGSVGEATSEGAYNGEAAHEDWDDDRSGGADEDALAVNANLGAAGEQRHQRNERELQDGGLGTETTGGASTASVRTNGDGAETVLSVAHSRGSADAGEVDSLGIGSGEEGRGGRGSGQRGPALAEGSTRTSRMTTYVARSGDRGHDDADRGGRDSYDETRRIDIAAIEAALRYETANGREAKEQPHKNPGYDIVSTAEDGSRRIIEVKGLAAEWTDRGTKLTRTQYTTAAEYRDQYWIYVVENARDAGRQRLSAIRNPFSQVDEYWFDQNWRDASEEAESLREINIRKGVRVSHKVWGNGTVIEVRRIGYEMEVSIDFGRLNGKKAIPLNSELEVID